MSLIPAKCTECGGILQVDKEKDAAVCPHCNTPFIIEKAINNYMGTAGQYDFEVRAATLIKYNGAAVDVIIPDNILHIGKSAFQDCTGLRSAVIPESIVSIGEYAFAECVNLKSIDIPDSVTAIGDYAFNGCSGLTEIIIPDSVTIIGDYVFAGCTSLRHIEIPDNITSVKVSVFNGCSKLTVINGKPKDEYSAFQKANSTSCLMSFLILCALVVFFLMFINDLIN